MAVLHLCIRKRKILMTANNNIFIHISRFLPCISSIGYKHLGLIPCFLESKNATFICIAMVLALAKTCYLSQTLGISYCIHQAAQDVAHFASIFFLVLANIDISGTTYSFQQCRPPPLKKEIRCFRDISICEK